MKLKLIHQAYTVTKYSCYGILLQCILYSMLIAEGSHAQKVSWEDILITVDLKDITVEEALSKIEAITDFTFAYPQSIVRDNTRFSLDAKDESLASLLRQISQETELSFRRVNNVIHVRKRKQETPMVEEADAYDKEISGKVSDENGEGLPGVNILIKNTGTGTITDANGNYRLSVPDDATILVFSYVGYLTEEVTIDDRTTLDITLTPDVSSLSEVVVVGYGTQKKVSLTGSVVSVDGEEISSIPTSSLSNTLAGRAPGVTIVNNSGFVGANSEILIRGVGSPNGTTPLFVIDNIVVDQADFDVLDPNEVESVTFLKDAATAAIYGARASNGVVLVTTKSGGNHKPKFTYKGFFTASEPTRPLQNFTAREEIIFKNDQATANGNPAPYGQEVLDYFEDRTYNLNDIIWRTPTSQQHDLSVSGGSDKLNYFMLAGFNEAKGPYHNTNFNRYNFRAKVDATINDYLKVGLNLSGNKRVTDRFYWPFDGDNGEGFELSDFYRTTFNWTRLYPHYLTADGTPTTRDDPNGFPITSGGWNPVEMLLNGNYRNIAYNTWNGILRIDLDIPFVEGLRTSVLGNYKIGTRNQKNFVIFNRSFNFQPQNPGGTNPFIPGPIDFNSVNVHNVGSSFERIDESAQFDDAYQVNWFLNYDRTFGVHEVSALLVYELAESSGKAFSGSAEDLLTNAVDQILAASSDTERRRFNGSEFNTARASWVGRLHYEFGSKYIAEFSFRSDASYKFPEDTRWGFFPSGSLAWRLSEENFFNVPLISSLKLRASVGTTGNDGTNDGRIAPFQFQNNYLIGNSYIFGDTQLTGLQAGTPPNPNITWEKSITYNGGMDFGLLDGKVYGEFDYFFRHNYDILAQRIRVIPGTYGAGLSDENYAEVDVKGFEITLGYQNNVGELNYSISGNMGYAIDEVKVLDEPEGLAPWRSAIGHPQNRHFGWISNGLITDQAALDNLPAGFQQFSRDPILGALLFEDIRGENLTEGADGKIDDNDQTWLSDNAIPRINYGINMNIEWKGLRLDVLFQGVGQYDKMVATRNTRSGGVFQVDRPYFELWTDAWSPTNQDGQYPRSVGWGRPEFGHGASSFWLRNGAYLRLKNLNLAYALPQHWISPLGLDNLQIFFTGTNLFVISGFEEHDPEQATLDSFPIMRSFTGGININF